MAENGGEYSAAKSVFEIMRTKYDETPFKLLQESYSVYGRRCMGRQTALKVGLQMRFDMPDREKSCKINKIMIKYETAEILKRQRHRSKLITKGSSDLSKTAFRDAQNTERGRN